MPSTNYSGPFAGQEWESAHTNYDAYPFADGTEQDVWTAKHATPEQIERQAAENRLWRECEWVDTITRRLQSGKPVAPEALEQFYKLVGPLVTVKRYMADDIEDGVSR